MKTTLYIAGPMTGLPEFNYPAFNEAEDKLMRAGYKTLNPVEAAKDLPGVELAWEWYMRSALRMVIAADGIALLPGWLDSRGAQLEVHVAESLGLPCLSVTTWLAKAA